MCFRKIPRERTRRQAFGAGVNVALESNSGELANFDLRGSDGVCMRERMAGMLRSWGVPFKEA